MDNNDNSILLDNNGCENKNSDIDTPFNVTQCEKGHFFDIASYDVCPFCGSQPENKGENKPTKKSGHNKKSGFFGLFKKEKDDYNKPIRIEPNKEPIDDDKTQGFSDIIVPTSVERADNVLNEQPVSISAVPDDTPTGGMFDIVIENQLSNENSKQQEQSLNSLNEQVKRVSAVQGDKTMGFFSTNLSTNKNTSTNINPVVGWLVCIDGNHLGDSFNIYTGRNSIGRSDVNKIVLDKDMSVSRDKHCFIIFEPKKCEFIFMHGESDSLTYVNDEPVYDKKQIFKNDKIQVGNCILLFVPLCDDNFKWDNLINKE
jgi:hypothetical protein